MSGSENPNDSFCLANSRAVMESAGSGDGVCMGWTGRISESGEWHGQAHVEPFLPQFLKQRPRITALDVSPLL